MIRTPLRPLARILTARARGENPDAIERENIRRRHEEMQARDRARAEGRLVVLGLFFLAGFVTIGLRMAHLSMSEPEEPVAANRSHGITMQRADIVDRNGHVLATNLETFALYAQPPQMVDPIAAAKQLKNIFPDLEEERLIRDFTGKRKFVWIKKRISPEQKQAVHDIGDPGLLFGPREMRLYPNGRLAAHVLGGATFGKEGVNAAEVIGVAGVEKTFDGFLRDPANEGRPLQLSIDLSVQDAAERVLEGGMRIMNARGATAILMDVRTGEVLSLVSLPDFDPNDRPRPAVSGDPSDSPLFNRAVQGVYELGSTFKIFTAAQAVDLGLVNPDTPIDTRRPLIQSGHEIGEFRNKNYGPTLTLAKVIEKSSNVGTARVAQMIGVERQKQFLRDLGLFDPTGIELVEARSGRPLLPRQWHELEMMTISYGHGMSTTPMNLAAAYATIANGGHVVSPTILKQTEPQLGPRVMSERTAAAARAMLRQVVAGEDGTASFAEVPGYEVAGKTGTADKPNPKGGYYKDKVIATFASMFPASDPKYVLVVTLDEPSIHAAGRVRRSAGWTAAPVAAELIARVAPLLGLRPRVEPGQRAGITLTSN
ncbi:peptidoglycan D,D-transpeptidase FtsI family protein [Jhaorihella thermophila]|uniref:Cell division protein FtsI (Penicillin-binding protein 3) n=1 Tax=Jhaorihella thermophila TaxID=488547 RepID=A0A1H5YA91_9RHOB|nr:penicillin-binding protein 2 [Jhaorihella thermophila]SEG20898.1 cell division protein FtsI (penicillin-binding protein 3) [Jhaorihella thermophila]